jgi:hypothetical protein
LQLAFLPSKLPSSSPLACSCPINSFSIIYLPFFFSQKDQIAPIDTACRCSPNEEGLIFVHEKAVGAEFQHLNQRFQPLRPGLRCPETQIAIQFLAGFGNKLEQKARN